MNENKEVTIWLRYSYNEKEFEHNHIEEGWSSLEAPLPNSQKQAKDWKGAKWKKEYAYLKDWKVVSPV